VQSNHPTIAGPDCPALADIDMNAQEGLSEYGVKRSAICDQLDHYALALYNRYQVATSSPDLHSLWAVTLLWWLRLCKL
jgi:hypothetical protein